MSSCFKGKSSNNKLPLVGFKSWSNKLAVVVLPLPVSPTKAILDPILIFKDKLFIALVLELGYWYEILFSLIVFLGNKK